MPKMTGGQALAKSLYREGVRVIFGLPGVQLYHLLDGLYDETGIRFVTTRHEQATTYMADGYARAGGGIGTALVVPGPGLQNASAGIGTAYSASSPILVVSGQIERDFIGVDRGMLHEVNDQMDTIRPVTKWASRILKPEDVPAIVHEAFNQLKTGRPRPVEIEIPPETLAEEAEIELLEPANPIRPAASAEQIQAGAEILGNAKKLIILAGGGVISSQASEALQTLAEYLQAPVITTSEGKGALSDRHELCLGALRLRQDPLTDYIAQTDVVLAVGTRLASPQMLSGQTVVQIDVDGAEIGRNYAKTVGLVGDAKRTLEALHTALAATGSARPSREDEVEALKRDRREDPHANLEPLAGFLKAIRNAVPDDGVVISGMTQVGYYSRPYYPVYQPRTFLTSSYFGNLGYAYPTALGAKVARPDAAVVAISGDGGFMFNSQELATAVAHKINAVVIVFNDNAFGNVMRDQRDRFEGRIYGPELHNPDFMKLAEAYGARGVRALNAEELEAKLKEALAIDAPTLLEVPVGPMPYPY
ncbi:MAG: thiamine pyrophosphate-binding protein [Candidatus Tectomicrobia bacterium]|nr:thiamine pyrophosphate-binding protein [Candidatus Tectomicrobia bacterium]